MANLITCQNCNKEFEFGNSSIKKDFGNGVFGFGIQCLYCEWYTHSFFEDKDLHRAKLSVKRALVAFRNSPTTKLWEAYQKKRTELNAIHDKTQEIHAHLLEVENG